MNIFVYFLIFKIKRKYNSSGTQWIMWVRSLHKKPISSLLFVICFGFGAIPVTQSLFLALYSSIFLARSGDQIGCQSSNPCRSYVRQAPSLLYLSIPLYSRILKPFSQPYFFGLLLKIFLFLPF